MFQIPESGGMLTALFQFHWRVTSNFILELTSLFVIINATSSLQIYGMRTFNSMKTKYIPKKEMPWTWWLRVIIRVMFGYGCFFVAVAMPFGSLGSLTRGIALLLTLVYPCFLWLKIKMPQLYSTVWCLNWALGLLGMSLSGISVAVGFMSSLIRVLKWASSNHN